MRHELIRAELARSGGVRIRDLMTRFGVSRATIRRDLHALVTAGDAITARGGAILPAGRTHRVTALEHETIANTAARTIMADEIKDLGLFGGPLINELARRLTDCPQLHVVTNSLAVARILSEQPTRAASLQTHALQAHHGSYTQTPHPPLRSVSSPQVTLLPGTLQPSGAALGSLAADALAALPLDAAYFDCVGFDPRIGATVDDLYEADLRRVTIQVSDRAVLLMERARLGAFAIGTFAAPCDLDAIITAG